MMKNLKTAAFFLIIALSAMLLDFGLQDWVEKISVRFAGEQELTISMADIEYNNGKKIQIYAGTNGDLFEDLKKASCDDAAWTFVQGKMGEKWTELDTDIRGAKIHIKSKPSPERSVIFCMAPHNGIVEVECGGRTQMIDTNRDEGVEITYFYPFQDFKPAYGFRIVVHILLFAIFSIVIFVCLKKIITIDLNGVVCIRSIIYLSLLSFFFVGTLKDPVNRLIVYHLLPQSEVSVLLEHEADLSLRTGDVRIPVAESNYLEEMALHNGEYLAIAHMSCVPEEYIRVPVSDGMHVVKYKLNGRDYTYEITDGDREAGFCRIYPFASSMLKLFLSILIYLLFSIVITCLLIMIHISLYVSDDDHKSAAANKLYAKPEICFFIVFSIIYAVGLYQYINQYDLPYYMPDHATGDQADYWNTYIFKDGFINFDIKISSFRGYTNYLLPSISKVIGARLNIDPVKVYLVFPALMFAWFTTRIIPEFYEIITKKKPKRISVILFFVIFSYYYKQCITSVTTDFYNNVLFFASIVYTIKAYRKNSMMYSVIAGASLSWMVNMHYSFLFFILVVAIGYPVCIAVKKIVDKKERGIRQVWKEWWIGIRSGFSGKRPVCLALAIACFLMVCIPQTIMNYKSGYVGLFPHDSENAYCGHPVSWSMWGTFLSKGMILWPKFIGDDQVDSMKTQLYEEKDESLNPAQAMDVYANSPIETAVTIAKKMFIIFDYKSNVNYGTEITWRETKGLLFSFFNYLVLLVGLYILIRKKDLPFPAKVMSWLIFVATIVLSMAGHVEQRGSITFYVVLCMFFTFVFLGEMLEDKGSYRELCDLGLYRFLAFGELVCFGISMTIWA